MLPDQGLKTLPRAFKVRVEQEPSAVFARLSGYARSRDEGFDFAVTVGPREVQSVFELTGLDRVLPMLDAPGERTGSRAG